MRMLMVTVAAVALVGCEGKTTIAEDTENRVVLLDGNAISEVTAADGSTITALAGFVRPAPEGAVSTAGYLGLVSSSDAMLTSAAAPGFSVVELHEVTEENGVSRMRRVDGIPIRARQRVMLEPGGYHLMMMGPQTVLSPGDAVPVELSFDNGAELAITLPVQRQSGPGTNHGNH